MVLHSSTTAGRYSLQFGNRYSGNHSFIHLKYLLVILSIIHPNIILVIQFFILWFLHSFIHLNILLVIHDSSLHLFILWFILWFIHFSFILWFMLSVIYSSFDSFLIHPLIHALSYLFVLWFIHTSFDSCFHLFIHPLILTYIHYLVFSFIKIGLSIYKCTYKYICLFSLRGNYLSLKY